MSFYIGNVEIKGRVVLAPMAGVSNPTFIKIVEGFGCSLAFTELISAEAVVRSNPRTFDMLKGLDKVSIPVGIQLFGSDPDTIASAAKIIQDKYHPALIDINMGCPALKVIKTGSGSALLKDPKKVFEIVKRVVCAVDIPVTVKMRSGWDSVNALEIAKEIEHAGASAITIHPRTAKQGFSGMSDWSIIKDIVDNVSIPVIGNGDIKSYKDAKKMLDETHSCAVAIGRSAMGNPWIIKECSDYLDHNILPQSISYNERIDMMEYHLRELVKLNGEKNAVLEMRGHILNYIKGLPENSRVKTDICKSTTSEEIIDILEEYRVILGTF